MVNGTGISGVYPSLADADNLINEVPRMLNRILNGDEVNGVSHSFSLSDQEASDLVNYIRNSLGHEGETILPEEIQPALQESEEGD